MHVFRFNPWEERRNADGQVEQMDERDWRYHVISFTGSNHTLHELEEAFMVAPKDLQIGFTFFNENGLRSFMWHSGRLFQKLDALRNHVFLEVDAADIAKIVEIHLQLIGHDEAVVQVRRLIRQLQDLRAVPGHSPLLFLGYFGLLESLLTHRPDPKDLYQSITRKVKTKIALLDSRFEQRLDYGAFPGVRPETVWAKMYEYRSVLAHGDVADFDDSLRLLGNGDNALKLLTESVKKVIRQALKEPRLLADLREC